MTQPRSTPEAPGCPVWLAACWRARLQVQVKNVKASLATSTPTLDWDTATVCVRVSVHVNRGRGVWSGHGRAHGIGAQWRMKSKLDLWTRANTDVCVSCPMPCDYLPLSWHCVLYCRNNQHKWLGWWHKLLSGNIWRHLLISKFLHALVAECTLRVVI